MQPEAQEPLAAAAAAASSSSSSTEVLPTAAAPIQLYPVKDAKLVSEYWAGKYEQDAFKYWDVFYKNNQEKFFKDRHYLFREFPELAVPEGATQHTVFEAGCGAGNTVYPILEADARMFVHCCDFSRRAVDLVKQHEQYNPERVNAFVCDITSPTSLAESIPAGTVDVIMCIFVLSAISPEKMVVAVDNMVRILRKNSRSRILVRDYAAGDLAEGRLESKSHRKISDNFYVRGDGTRAYYFEEKMFRELFEKAGLETFQLKVNEVEVENRARKLKMDRRWIQGAFGFKA